MSSWKKLIRKILESVFAIFCLLRIWGIRKWISEKHFPLKTSTQNATKEKRMWEREKKFLLFSFFFSFLGSFLSVGQSKEEVVGSPRFPGRFLAFPSLLIHSLFSLIRMRALLPQSLHAYRNIDVRCPCVRHFYGTHLLMLSWHFIWRARGGKRKRGRN